MDLAELVGGAASGDRAAWERIVERFSGLVWAVVRSHRLGDADAADAFQTTWLRLVEHLGELREPDRLGSWLATTARRECLRTLRAGRRLVPVEDAGADLVADVPDPDRALGLPARDRALMAALAEVSERCRRLLRLLMADPAPSYREVGAALDMPIGSIGPTRERCLARLREGLAARGITADP
ncbi:MAG: sigma-70 family RNA polymerase sigma factor [Thermoleophilia bacterium]|nr:sigma-70 family RNA polymerase sigma factor [Thermoleophilia bacterium]